MRSSSTTGIVREERSKTVSKPHHYSHLKLPPRRTRTANKTPGNFPTVVAHKPSGTCHRSFFLWERSNLSCNRGSSRGRTNVREVRVLEFAWWIKGHLSGFILRFLLINALGHWWNYRAWTLFLNPFIVPVAPLLIVPVVHSVLLLGVFVNTWGTWYFNKNIFN
jgi:hypothetical protein